MGKRTILVLYLLFCISTFSTNDERIFDLLYKKIPILEFKIFMIEPINVNVKNSFGWTPLMIASGFYTNPDFCDILIKNGARINERDLNWWTPLFFSCAFNENYMVTDLLIRKKADINIQDIYGNSPIFYATQSNRYDTVNLLIKSSAQLNFSNFEGNTILDICYKKNIGKEMERLLISAGARKSISDQGSMIKVQEDTFEMGDTSKVSYSDEKPLRKILLSSFLIGKYEVTFMEYDLFCSETQREKPSDNGWGRGLRPVINISWLDATSYCNWLSKKNNFKPAYDEYGNFLDRYGKKTSDPSEVEGFRLPTEAEWEYCAKFNLSKAKTVFSSSNNIDEVGWYEGNSMMKSHSVGLKKPNDLGIHDMNGNVMEWCSDFYAPYFGNTLKNPIQTTGKRKVVRGGSYNYLSSLSRNSKRMSFDPEFKSGYLGFRIVRSILP